jgi:hypothetical protein
VSLDPDNPELRSFLHWHLTFNMAHKAVDEESRAEWYREGLEIMDEGLARTPDDYRLNREMGATLYLKAGTSPGFDALCVRRYGRGPVQLAPVYLEKAFKARPDFTTLLFLYTALLRAAHHAMEAGEYAEAAAQWQKVLEYLPAWFDRMEPGGAVEKEELTGYYRDQYTYCTLMDRARKGEEGLEPKIEKLRKRLEASRFFGEEEKEGSD